MKTIEITVSTDGSMKIETHGFVGGECRDASRFLELALGQRQSERLTADFYREAVTEAQATQRHQTQ